MKPLRKAKESMSTTEPEPAALAADAAHVQDDGTPAASTTPGRTGLPK
jgi:hypothetical protein